MIVYIATRSARISGGNSTFSLVGNYLGSGLRDYGPAIRQLEIIVCFRGGRVGHSSLQRSYDDFHSTFLPSLPLVKFFRKKGCIDLQYETSVADATFLERKGFLSADVFGSALNEVSEKLRLMEKRLTNADNFDLQRFYGDVSRLVVNAPNSDEELRALKATMDHAAKDRLAAMDPWERLDVDWDEYHPAARTLLNEPFFWSQSDGYSPHGNDTSADVLSDFKKWDRRHPNTPAHEMATALLRAWEIIPADYNVADESAVKKLLGDDAIDIGVTHDALIAVAFAAVKVRGCCDAATRRLALAAIEREAMASVVAARGWKEPAERSRTLDLLSNALSKVPETRT